MYHHIKSLMYTVRVDQPDPRFGNMLLEQFGGENGELAAALQYSIQGLNCEDPERKDLLMDIGTEELSHLEIVGTLARMHLRPMKTSREAAEADPLVAIAGGGGVRLCNAMGGSWTADYLKITGELDVDLRSNIAAEARAKIVYERLINFCDDQGTKDALQFLMTREVTHMKAFSAALESLRKPIFSIGRIPPSAGIVDKYFNASTGQGDEGEPDARGPWNQGGEWDYTEAERFRTLRDSADTVTDALEPAGAELLEESLVDLLEDLLDAEMQLTKALPIMAENAHSMMLRQSFEKHLAETEKQISRLQEIFELFGEQPAPKPCKGMIGLIDEGNEVIESSRDREKTAADLALIASAQKVEHYEIAAYCSAITLAHQLGEQEAALLLQTSLEEERTTDKILSRLSLETIELVAHEALELESEESEIGVDDPDDEVEDEKIMEWDVAGEEVDDLQEDAAEAAFSQQKQRKVKPTQRQPR